MTSIKVIDGVATLYLTLSAEYTGDTTEPLLTSQALRVPRDHRLLRALVDTWRIDDQTGETWVDDPLNDPEAHALSAHLWEVLAVFFGTTDA